jgi:aminoglycoside/choline kinase family phosphotransferase
VGATRADPARLPFRRRFDEAILRWELEHFREWLLEKGRGVHLTEREATTLDEGFAWLASTLASSPLHLVHRDFQSRNLMVVAGAGGLDLRVIDFQDALLGSQAYDLVALLRDSYMELEQMEVDDLLATFAAEAGLEGAAELRNLFQLQTLQRKLKDAGRFVYLDRVRGNASYLRWIPSSLRYAAAALCEIPHMAPAAAILQRHVPELSIR